MNNSEAPQSVAERIGGARSNSNRFRFITNIPVFLVSTLVGGFLGFGLIAVLDGVVRSSGRSCPEGLLAVALGIASIFAGLSLRKLKMFILISFLCGLGVGLCAAGGFAIFLMQVLPSC